MHPQSEVAARIYARLARYREANELVNPVALARQLVREVPDAGMSERELAELVARHATSLRVPVELDGGGAPQT
jgi:hypothetical protein